MLLVARNALKRKKVNEQSLATTQAQITTLEQQIHSIESATLNYETLRVMKDAGQAMKTIHGGMDIDKVEETMYAIPISSHPLDTLLTFPGDNVGKKSAKALPYLAKWVKLLLVYLSVTKSTRMSSSGSSRIWSRSSLIIKWLERQLRQLLKLEMGQVRI